MNARKRLGEMLVEQGAIDDVQLSAALGHQKRWGGKLGQTLVDLRIVPEPVVVDALARSLDCEPVSVAALANPSPDAVRLVPADLARRHQILALELVSDGLVVASADPWNVAALDEVRFRTGRRLKVRLAGARALARAIERAYLDQELPALDLDEVVLDDDLPGSPFVVERSAASFQERFFASGLREATATALRDAPAPAPALRAVRDPAPDVVTNAAPASVVHALAAVLVRRGLVTEAELVAELGKRAGG
jgi:type IV pilus assembly protein PilB